MNGAGQWLKTTNITESSNQALCAFCWKNLPPPVKQFCLQRETEPESDQAFLSNYQITGNRGQRNILNQTTGMQSAKYRLWETINKQFDVFNKQIERKKIPRYEGGMYSLK